jgi:hypothetical protein
MSAFGQKRTLEKPRHDGRGLSARLRRLPVYLPGQVQRIGELVGFAVVMSRRLLRRLSARVEADKRPLIELAGETLFYVVIAGVLILLYQPFGYGDKITVAGNSGTVIGINFRYTVLGAYGGTVVHVPNSTMFSNSVTVEPKTGEAP